MKERLLDYLCCPKCKGDLKMEIQETKQEQIKTGKLICSKCQQEYEIRDGIPIMLDKQSRVLLQQSSKPSMQIGLFKQQISKILRKMHSLEPYSINSLYQRVEKFLNYFDYGAKTCDLGCGYRRFDQRIVNLDITLSEYVDIVGDAHILPFADETFDGIICTSVLEHVWNPVKVVNEIYRILKKGGKIYIEVPFLYPYHPVTETDMDYQRYTEAGLLNLFKDFKPLELGVSGGPNVVLIVFLRQYFSELFNFWHNHDAPREIISIITGWILLPLKYLDPLLIKRKSIASIFYFVGEK